MTAFDQFTRWKCSKCGKHGIDSWNKAVWDGPGFETVEEIPNPWILGDNCQLCLWPVVVIYREHDAIPRAIYGPDAWGVEGGAGFSYESEAFEQAILPDAGEPLEPSTHRDHDWSGGCMNLTPAPEIEE